MDNAKQTNTCNCPLKVSCFLWVYEDTIHLLDYNTLACCQRALCEIWNFFALHLEVGVCCHRQSWHFPCTHSKNELSTVHIKEEEI